MWLPASSDSKESACTAGTPGLIPGLGKILWRREWQLTWVFFLPGESHRQRSLGGYSLWVHKQSDVTERLTLRYYYLPLSISSVRSAVESNMAIIVSPGSNNLDSVLVKIYLLKEWLYSRGGLRQLCCFFVVTSLHFAGQKPLSSLLLCLSVLDNLAHTL